MPRDEELKFEVSLDFGVLGDPTVGTVVVSSKVEPFVSASPLLVGGGDAVTDGERVALEARAHGGYAVYKMDESISTLLLPQEWPSAIHRMTQTGTENRRRELLLGTIDGRPTASYRSDDHCKGCDRPEHFVSPNWPWEKPHHCKKCKRAEHRVWLPSETRRSRPNSVDMVTAVFLARSMVAGGPAHGELPARRRRETSGT